VIFDDILYRNGRVCTCNTCDTSVRVKEGKPYCPVCERFLNEDEFSVSEFHVPISSYDHAHIYFDDKYWMGTNWRGD